MTIQGFTFNPFQTNAYIIHDGTKAAIIDPSSSTPAEHGQIIDYVEENGLDVTHLLLTHAHIDHIFGLSAISSHFGLPFRVNRSEAPLLDHAAEQARMFGVDLELPPRPGEWIEEGEVIRVGEIELVSILTPGHSPGSMSFHSKKGDVLLAGDVLFQGSIGRTDLWQGSLPVLMRSIFEKLVPLGDKTVVYPGHGPSTQIGRERMSNPFLTEGYSSIS
jgi:hydroxyacylglutathione hydrolase